MKCERTTSGSKNKQSLFSSAGVRKGAAAPLKCKGVIVESYEKLLDDLYVKMPTQTAKSERFEMPVFFSFIEGTRTVIKNFKEVADALRREPAHLLKYVSKELAVPGTLEGQRAILIGKFRDELVNQKLTNYIKEYVFCKECKKPDTSLITYEGVKYKRCEVCGARSPVNPV